MSQFNFQKGSSPLMCEFMFFHDQVLLILIFVMILVMGLMYLCIKKSYKSINLLEHNSVEVIWTLAPGLVLLILALPSLKLLYYLDLSNSNNPFSTIKVVGHQWYWSYGCSYNTSNFGLKELDFDSYLSPSSGLEVGGLRLLETDLSLVVPVGEFVRLLVGSTDVIHSFSIKTLGMKVDAVPGRLNYGYLYSSVLGKFYGQCSEMCGAHHAFMPMSLEVMNSFKE